jgi:hypothetical protein
LQPEHVLPLKAPIAQTKIGERRGSAKKRSNKIVAGSHSHYFIYHHNVLFYAIRKIVGAASCRDQ